MFLSFRKNKETKCISVQISKKFKRPAVSLSKMCRLKIFVTYQNFLRTLETHYKIFDNKKIACSATRFDLCRLSKKCGFATFSEIQLKLCQFECQKVEQNLTAFKKQTGCFSVFYLDVTYRTLIAFQNGFGEIRDVCSFEDIRQSRFHAKLFKCK